MQVTAAAIQTKLDTQYAGISVYASNIEIHAQYININGTMQSGKDALTLNLGAAAQAEIRSIIASGAAGQQADLDGKMSIPGTRATR